MEMNSDLRMSISMQTRVSLSLSEKILLTAGFKESNIVFSPLSIYVALGMISVGSEDETQEQLLGFLKADSFEDLHSLSSKLVKLLSDDASPLGGPRLSFANSVWVDATLDFKPEFEQVVENTYKAVSNHVDFKKKADEAAEQVNSWADKKTNGLINVILPPDYVDSLTKLIFVNAVYFKGTWEQKFDASKTKDDEFFLSDGNGTTIQVPFMTSKKKQYIKECIGFKVLKLAYKKGQDKRLFTMLIYLPDGKDDLPSLIEKVCSERRFIENHLPNNEVQVGDFRIPKFKFNFWFDASHNLQELGLTLPFSEGGLTNMVQHSETGKKLYVSNIVHKAFIEVNEQGTEAAATSAGVLGVRAVLKPNLKPDFVADHPFLFIIRENLTGVVFFVGQVQNPAFA